MAKIPFNIKYRPQIESGEYKVETKNGLQVEILKFGIKGTNFHIVGIIHRNSFDEVASWTKNGSFYPYRKENQNDLVLITPEPELTEFENNIRVCIMKHLAAHTKDEDGNELIGEIFIDDDTTKKMVSELLEKFKRFFAAQEIEKRLNAAYHNQDEDEKIKNTLIGCCDDWSKGRFVTMSESDIDRIRDWIKKQKTTDNIPVDLYDIKKSIEYFISHIDPKSDTFKSELHDYAIELIAMVVNAAHITLYNNRDSFESALSKAWNTYHNGYEKVDALEDDYIECVYSKGFREGYLFGKTKDTQKQHDSQQ